MLTKELEIGKVVQPPRNLSPKVIDKINELCFNPMPYVAGDCDAAIIFGTSSEPNQKKLASEFPLAFAIYKPKIVYLTGGETSEGDIESRRIYFYLFRYGGNYQSVEFKIDEQSKDTKQNVEEAIKVGLDTHKRILFITKSPHCGRCFLTLRKYLPNVELMQHGYNPIWNEKKAPVTMENWSTTPEVIKMVWAEFLRIERYGLRGDIAYPEEIRKKVSEIHTLTHT